LAEFGKTAEQLSWGKRVRNPRAMELIKVDEVATMLDRVMSQSAFS